jgi:shikimate kinase
MNPKEKTSSLPNLYLIGFMGTGKSSAGLLTAQKLNLQFIDSDGQIETLIGSSISNIFKIQGEKKFRELEKKFIQSGHPQTGCVVSCGGGLPIPEGMVEILKSKGKVFSLHASLETIVERTSKNDSRPLLQSVNLRNEIKSLLRKREPRYLLADQVISTEQRRTEQVADEIVRHYLNSIS